MFYPSSLNCNAAGKPFSFQNCLLCILLKSFPSIFFLIRSHHIGLYINLVPSFHLNFFLIHQTYIQATQRARISENHLSFSWFFWNCFLPSLLFLMSTHQHAVLFLQLSNYSSFEGVLYCRPHYDQLFKRTGSLDKSFEGKSIIKPLWKFTLSNLTIIITS